MDELLKVGQAYSCNADGLRITNGVILLERDTFYSAYCLMEVLEWYDRSGMPWCISGFGDQKTYPKEWVGKKVWRVSRTNPSLELLNTPKGNKRRVSNK